jgi:predicted membrane chloride channel (bestrophin family)
VCTQLPYSLAVISLPLLFFFIVFYNNNSYSRFYTLYGHTVGLGANTMEWTALVKLHSDPTDRAGQWNAVRLLLAGMNILYYSLFGPGLDDGEWARIMERNLLSHEEVWRLKSYEGFKPFLAVCWALEEAQKLVNNKSKADKSMHYDLGQSIRAEHIHSQFREVAFSFRGHCGQIVNLLKQPVPFPYFHLLNIMLLVQLLLLAYAIACTPGNKPYFSIPIMVLVSIVLIGMRGLAVQLSNPFGEDSVDFEIESFMKGAYTNAVAHLKSEKPETYNQVPAGLSNPLLDTFAGAPTAWKKPASNIQLPPPQSLPPPRKQGEDTVYEM